MKNKSEIQPCKLAKVVWRHVPTMHAPISSSAAVFRGKETAGPKNTHIIEQKTNYPLRTVLENSSRYGWETNFLFVPMWGVAWRNACEMQLLRWSKVSGEHKMFLCKCYSVNFDRVDCLHWCSNAWNPHWVSLLVFLDFWKDKCVPFTLIRGLNVACMSKHISYATLFVYLMHLFLKYVFNMKESLKG